MTNRAPSLSSDRPALTGDEPVLSGVNSRVLADRRGAYLAGNLRALLGMMSDRQYRDFCAWCWKIGKRLAKKGGYRLEDEAMLVEWAKYMPGMYAHAIKRWLKPGTKRFWVWHYYSAQRAQLRAAYIILARGGA